MTDERAEYRQLAFPGTHGAYLLAIVESMSVFKCMCSVDL